MTRYEIHHSDGREAETHDTYDEACDALRAQYPDAEIGHDGDLSEGGDQTLVLEPEEESAKARRKFASLTAGAVVTWPKVIAWVSVLVSPPRASTIWIARSSRTVGAPPPVSARK